MLGLVGAIRENRCLLIAFSVVLGLLIFVEIALLVTLLALAREQNLGSIANNKMTESMKRYDEEGYEGVTTGKLNSIYTFNSQIYQALINFQH